MATVITILILIGAVLLLAIFLLAFSYPDLLVRAGKFLFVKPLRAVFRSGHHKAATLAVKAAAVKPDVTQMK